MYTLTVIEAVYNTGEATETLEFDTFDEMQDYIIENNIDNYRIGL